MVIVCHQSLPFSQLEAVDHQFQFLERQDAKDQNATLYQILLLKGTAEPALNDSLSVLRLEHLLFREVQPATDYRYDFNSAIQQWNISFQSRSEGCPWFNHRKQ